jgi:hypothetical protein
MEVFKGVFIVRKIIPTRSSGGGGGSSSRRGGAGGGAAISPMCDKRRFLPTNEKSKTHVALNLMFLKVLYARAFTRGGACEGKGKRKGRRKEKEKVRACSAHQGRTSAAKSCCMREQSDAPEARFVCARSQKKIKQRAPQARPA